MTTSDRQAKCFDLVELTDPVGDLPRGSHGTVTVQGIGQAIVDFSWCDEGTPPGCTHLHRVSTESMRVLERRTFNQAIRARRVRT
jgi:hypothetical protein